MVEKSNICKYCKHYQKEYVAVSSQVAYLVKEDCTEDGDVHSEATMCRAFEKKWSHRLKEFLLRW